MQLVLKNIFKFFLNTIPRPWLIKISFWLKPLFIFYYKGSTFTDPIDGKSFRKLLPYGYQHQRENALSPSTLSLERHRLLWLFLKNETDFFGFDTSKKYQLRKSASTILKVLHFAPEQCFYHRFKNQKNIDYLTTDLNSPLADVKADICSLPFQDNEFDIIFCNHVLEHIPNDTKAMQELYRVLKKEGMGIFQIPQDVKRANTFEDNSIINKEERTRIFGQYDHVRVYGLDYFDKLKTIGFKVEALPYAKNLKPEDVKKFALQKDEILPVCFK